MKPTRLLLPALLVTLVAPCLAQPIFDYVNKPDPAFAYEKVSDKQLPDGSQLTELKMTSQVWQGLTWTHQLVLVRPVKMTHPDTAVLLINGGKLGGSWAGTVATIANQAGAPIVYLGDIPNQPLFNNLHEDALIAYTFTKYLQTHDATWPLLYPMAKAAVRAMDAVEGFTQKEWQQPVSKFVVTGASKRGWTTWFTGEVDTKPGRVVGLAPIVFDNLNLPAQMALQKSSYGVYSSQIEDYTALGLPDLLQTEAGKLFGSMVDPYTYRDRATMPKIIINGSNDPYWVVDSANLYFGDLTGTKYLMYAPNTGHGNGDFMRILAAEVGFYLCCTGQVPFPKLNWQFEDKDALTLSVSSEPSPQRMLQWTATAETRDFRKAKWESQELQLVDGKYVGRLPHPAAGYAAMFCEAMYDAAGRQFPVSTQIQVIKAP